MIVEGFPRSTFVLLMFLISSPKESNGKGLTKCCFHLARHESSLLGAVCLLGFARNPQIWPLTVVGMGLGSKNTLFVLLLVFGFKDPKTSANFSNLRIVKLSQMGWIWVDF